MRVALAVTLALSPVLVPTPANAEAPMRLACRYQFDDGHAGWNIAEARREIVCAFGRFAPSQVGTALAIAERESGLHATAVNHYSGAGGLFQHLPRYWASRVLSLGRRAWFPRLWPNVPILNARANAIITARYVAVEGWGAWS
jgi:hypothetical protein